jgi:hypothetical protein
VARQERDYLDWMLGAEDMDEEVLAVVRSALAGAIADPAQLALIPEEEGGPEPADAAEVEREAEDASADAQHTLDLIGGDPQP